MEQFIKKVLDQFTDDITDRVFLMIQNDSKLMGEYLNLLNRHKEEIDLPPKKWTLRRVGSRINTNSNQGGV